MAFWRNHSERINALRAFFKITAPEKVERPVRPQMKVTYVGAGDWSDSPSRPRSRHAAFRSATGFLREKFGVRSEASGTFEWPAVGGTVTSRRNRRLTARNLAKVSGVK
jgi:hypothetical protein